MFDVFQRTFQVILSNIVYIKYIFNNDTLNEVYSLNS
jgi:hypothetical protein